ncbi:MAG: hypothetical protein ACI8V5_004034 [Limisphaerales bacterium]|jgi:hypothetical protein
MIFLQKAEANTAGVREKSKRNHPDPVLNSFFVGGQNRPSLKLCITHKFAICGAASFPFIPTGLCPPAQGWPSATAAGLPWVLGPASKQPQRGCAQIADDWRNTFGVENAS